MTEGLNVEYFLESVDLNNPDFENRCIVHDWRNYVPENWMDKWHKFTDREKIIIAVMAETIANKEEWD